MSNSESLEELKKLCEAATPGPWAFDTDSCDCGDGYGCSHGEFPHAINVPSMQVPWGFAAHKPDATKHAAEIVNEFGENASVADGEFIAAARTALPHLIAEVERLTDVVAMMHKSGVCLLSVIRPDESGTDLVFMARQADIDSITTRLYVLPAMLPSGEFLTPEVPNAPL